MKKQDITALHQKTASELKQLVTELSSTLARVRLAQKARKAGNTHAQLIADDIARVKAVLRTKELASQAVAQQAEAKAE